jgi:hypothetical protein
MLVAYLYNKNEMFFLPWLAHHLRTAGPIWIILFFMFVIVRIRFYGKKNWKSFPENSGKTESAFFYGNGWNDLAFFFNVRNNPYEVLM